jgi:hypothetical protein
MSEKISGIHAGRPSIKAIRWRLQTDELLEKPFAELGRRLRTVNVTTRGRVYDDAANLFLGSRALVGFSLSTHGAINV